MDQSGNERRGTRRFALHLPIAFRYGGVRRAVSTRDISARGVSFQVDGGLPDGARFDFMLTLPPELTMTEEIQVQCSAHVVRSERLPSDGKAAVAAIIDRYEFLGKS